MLARVVVDELRSRREEVLATIAQGDAPAREEQFEALMDTVGHACSTAVARIATEPSEVTPEAAPSAVPQPQPSEQLLECIRRGEVDAVLGTGPMAGEVLVLKTHQLEQENRRLIEALRKEKERLEEFAFATAHDLRGPLTNIENGISTLLEQHARLRLPLWFVDSLRHIEHAAVRMRLLVSDLMVLGEVGSEGELVRVPLLDIVAAVLDGQRPALTRTRVHVEIIDQLPTVRGRMRHLEAMFDNLLDNAIRYASTAARGRVQIACEERDDEIVICVRDNGPGFDQREAEAVFEPYVCLDHQTEENTGLGLAIVRNAARAHGGRAWIETVPGEGTAAFVALPLSCALEPESASSPAGPSTL